MKTMLGRTVIRKSELKEIGGFEALLQTKHIDLDTEEKALVEAYLAGKMTKKELEAALMALPM